MTDSTFTLAQIVRKSKGVEGSLNDFFASPVGGVVDNLLDVAAIGALCLGLWLILKALKSSNPGAEMAKKALWPFVGATLLWQLDWTTTLIGLITKAIAVIIDSVVILIPGLG